MILMRVLEEEEEEDEECYPYANNTLHVFYLSSF
jgi:hypothetical protein